MSETVVVVRRLSPDDVGAALGLGRAFVDRHVLGGKRLRRRLVDIVAGAGGEPRGLAAVRYGRAIELIHAGALIHDDIMDVSTVRRGLPTLWSEVGVRRSVLAGVALMLLAEADLASGGQSLRTQSGLMLREVARGQTDELAHAFSTSVSPEAYLRRAHAKTATLYELAARLGAAAGGLGPRETDAVADFAAKLGLAFQLADDVRDLVGGAALGRPPGTDLCVGVYTLPVLSTLAGRFPRGDRLRELLVKVTAGEGVEECVELLEQNGALEFTASRARALVRDATERVSALGSLASRVLLQAYATQLLGPLAARPQATSRTGGEACRRPHRGWMGRPMALGDVVLVSHSTIPSRLARLRDRIGPSNPLVDVATVAAAIVWLAEEIVEPDAVSDGEADWARLRAVASIDLLVADLFVGLAPLSARHAEIASTRLVELLLRRMTVSREDGPAERGDDSESMVTDSLMALCGEAR